MTGQDESATNMEIDSLDKLDTDYHKEQMSPCSNNPNTSLDMFPLDGETTVATEHDSSCTSSQQFNDLDTCIDSDSKGLRLHC